MVKLKVKKFLKPVKASARYTICDVTQKPELIYAPLLLALTKDDDGVDHGLFVPTWNQIKPSPTTNAGRLVLAFGDNTDSWIGKKIDIRIDQRGRKLVYPVTPA